MFRVQLVEKVTTPSNIETFSMFDGVVTFSTSTTTAVHHRVATSGGGTDTLGVDTNFSNIGFAEINVYTRVMVIKLE